MGSMRGRKPLVVDTMKAGKDMSLGLVSSRTIKSCLGETDIVEIQSREMGECS